MDKREEFGQFDPTKEGAKHCTFPLPVAPVNLPTPVNVARPIAPSQTAHTTTYFATSTTNHITTHRSKGTTHVIGQTYTARHIDCCIQDYSDIVTQIIRLP